MKKWFALFLSVLMLATLAMPTSAAKTGEYFDDIVDGFAPEVVAYSREGEDPNNSHFITFEDNQDLERTLLLKTAAPRSSAHTEWIVYEMSSMIAGFEFNVMCLAGLGDPLTDLSVFVGTSADGPWTEISTQATRYEMVKYPGTDEDVYISEDTAYWWQSTLMNKAKINNKGKFLKIQFNPCTDKDDVSWNVAIDSVKVTLGNNVDAPTIPAEKKFKTWAKIKAENDATKTTANSGANNTTANNSGSNNTTANNSGSNNTTANNGGANNTTVNNAGTNNTTVNNDGSVDTNTTTNVDGIVDTNTTTAADGSVDTNTTTAANGDNASGDSADTNDKVDDNKDTNADPVKKGNVLPWIICGVVVLAAAAVIVLVVLKKKA